ncbi:MAG: hypothetical protein D6706_17240 [Chloroflexi bacterium]|nr:MAG: hypothetical protein D6706_17240 [Chloroflexota bacterium]
MAAKLLMQWDIRQETESEYFEFLVHEFIPGLNKLGIDEIQVWYTAYGNCEQMLTSGIAESAEHMQKAMQSDQWKKLIEELQQYVNNFSKKVVNATRGFQI